LHLLKNTTGIDGSLLLENVTYTALYSVQLQRFDNSNQEEHWLVRLFHYEIVINKLTKWHRFLQRTAMLALQALS